MMDLKTSRDEFQRLFEESQRRNEDLTQVGLSLLLFSPL